MDSAYFIQQLQANQKTFLHLFEGLTAAERLWKASPDHWCPLEVLCHLHDEEVEDFRIRLKLVLESPDQDPPPIDPPAWVQERNYIGQNFDEMLSKWMKERTASLEWLQSLQHPQWDNAYQHATRGPLSGHFYLTNWVAHDYLHIRQLIRIKYDYASAISGQDVAYAGTWK